MPIKKKPVASDDDSRPESPSARLMREMGSEKGFDPIPPDQYLHFLGKGEPPLQRLLALVRATTIRQHHRSAYCVDAHGRELHQADLERLLGMHHGNFSRAWREALNRGLIKTGAGETEAAVTSTMPNGRVSSTQRVYLCGSVKESTIYEVGEEKASVCTDACLFFAPAFCSPSLNSNQKKIVGSWPDEKQHQFYARLTDAVKYSKQVQAAAVAAARALTRPVLDSVLADFELPTKAPAASKASDTSAAVKLTVLAPPPALVSKDHTVSLDTENSHPLSVSLDHHTTKGQMVSDNHAAKSRPVLDSVLADFAKAAPSGKASVQTPKQVSVQTPASLLQRKDRVITPPTPPSSEGGARRNRRSKRERTLMEKLQDWMEGKTDIDPLNGERDDPKDTEQRRREHESKSKGTTA